MMAMAAVVLAVSACQGDTEQPQPFDSPVLIEEPAVPEGALQLAPAPPNQDGRLTLAMRQPQTLNPLRNEDVTVDRVLKLVFERLVVLDEHHRPVPNLAQSIVFSPDGTSAVITLRDDVVWSDGVALSAQDVYFSLRTIQSAGERTLYADALTNVAAFAVVDDRTLTIQYSRADSAALYRLAFPVIPQHHYNQPGVTAAATDMAPMGNGKFRLDSYTLAKEAILFANPYFFRGIPRISEIRVLITPDHETDLFAFAESIIHVLLSTVSEWGRYRGAKDALVIEYDSLYYEFIGFNFQRPAFTDVRLRQAIAHAIDMDYLMDSVYFGHADRAFTPVHPNSWLFEPGVVTYDFDPDRANLLLLQMGFRQEVPFVILVNEENAERMNVADILRDSLAGVGINAVVSRQPFGRYTELAAAQAWDLLVGGFNMGMVPDLSFAFYSGNTPNLTAGGQNVFLYRSTILDALFAQASGAVDESAYQSALSDIQRLFAEELPVISVAFRKNALLLDRKVQGDVRPAIDDIFANSYEWVINEE